MKLAKLITFCFLSLVLLAGAVQGQSLGTAFTYQGQLQDGGQPANGIYNFNFRVFSMQTGGVQIGPSLGFNDQLVTDGLFTMELDFTPAIFNDNTEPGDRWLQIAVNGTVLTPRQPFSGAPYSIQTRGLDVVEDGGGMRVGVGRVANNFADAFNVFTNTTNFGGMTVETPAGGNPAYAYQSGANQSVYHYLDHDDQAWRLRNAGERIYVGSDGFVGINKDTKSFSSEVFGVYRPTTSGAGIIVETDDFGDPYFGYATGGELRSYMAFDDDDDQWKLLFRDAASGQINARIYVTRAGNMGVGVSNPNHQLQLSLNSAAKPTSSAWTIFSDRRLKTDIQSLDGALDQLMQLRGVTYRWKDPASQGGMDSTYPGFIAQDVEPVFPDWIDEDSDGYKKLTVIGFEALAVEALRELRDEKNKQIATLDHKNDELQQENSELRDRMEVLEAQVQQLAETMQTQQR